MLLKLYESTLPTLSVGTDTKVLSCQSHTNGSQTLCQRCQSVLTSRFSSSLSQLCQSCQSVLTPRFLNPLSQCCQRCQSLTARFCFCDKITCSSKGYKSGINWCPMHDSNARPGLTICAVPNPHYNPLPSTAALALCRARRR